MLWASPWVAGATLALLGKRWGRVSGWVAFVAVSASALAAALLGSDLQSASDPALQWPWIPTVGITFAMRLDALCFPFVVNVIGVSLAATFYAWGYLRDDGRLHLFYALLMGFVGGMLGTLLASDVFLFLIFWESMLVTSSLLLAGWGERRNLGRVVLKYFIYTQVGSHLILASLIVLVSETGGTGFAEIGQNVSSLSRVELIWLTVLLTAGFCVKMAVFPLHTWLPDAHSVAPMPVTILLAAAMLSMGAYGILRFPIVILGAEGVQAIQGPLMILALVSEAYGALMCLASRDIKRLVAYSSVSQMGYVLFGFASLAPRGVAGGIFHVISHGILKALLFMGVGLIMRATGRRQMDELGGLAKRMPTVAAGIGVGAIAIAGMPPFCAFHGEWLIFSGGLSSAYPILGYLEFLAPVLTAAYALWFVARLAFGPEPSDLGISPTHRAMRASFWALVLASLLLGLFPSPVYRWVGSAVSLLTVGS